MINLVLLSGFLGAGKTTLMENILDAYNDKKLGVIVNEFGSVNIDAVLIKRNGIEMAELTNGSIFCACIKDKFVDSLIEMSSRDIEYMFIEASGLADPSNMGEILDGISIKTKGKYDYKGSICIVDGENFLDLYELLPAITNQLEFSSAVIINKVDLIDDIQLGSVLEKIKEINIGAKTFVTSFCKINIIEAVESIGNIHKEPKATSNTIESKPKSFVLTAEKPLPLDNLKSFIDEIIVGTYRIKGFANTDNGAVEISTVGNNVKLNNWDEELNESKIVVISSVGIKIVSILTSAIDKNLKGLIHM
jgi:G3E family GTPase